jgi:hypothetical protein
MAPYNLSNSWIPQFFQEIFSCYRVIFMSLDASFLGNIMKKRGRSNFREVKGLARFNQGSGEEHSYLFYHKTVPEDVGEHPLLFHQGEALLSRGDGSLFQYGLNLLSDLSL